MAKELDLGDYFGVNPDSSDDGEALNVIGLSGPTNSYPEKWVGDPLDQESPTAVQGFEIPLSPQALKRQSSQQSSKSVASSSSNVSTSNASNRSNRSVVRSAAKNASKRMSKAEASNLFSSTLRNLFLPGIGPSMLEIGARTFRDLTAGQSLKSDDFVHSGALALVLDLASQFSSHPGASEEACRLVAALCDKSNIALELINKRQSHLLFCEILRTHVNTYASVSEAAISALGATCSRGRVQDLQGGVKLILSAMRRWKGEARHLVASALRAIELSCSEGNSANQFELAEYGGIEEVTACLIFFGEDSKLVAYGISTVIAISADSEEFREGFGAAGAVQATINALNLYSSKLDIASYAALACRSLCLSANNRERLNEVAGMSALLNTLQAIAKREREKGSESHKDGIAHCILAITVCIDHRLSKCVVLDRLDILAMAAGLYKRDSRLADYVSKLLSDLFLEGYDGGVLRRKIVAEGDSPKAGSSNQMAESPSSGVGGLGMLFSGFNGGRNSLLTLIDVSIDLFLQFRTRASIVLNLCLFFRRCLNMGFEKDFLKHQKCQDLESELRKVVEIHAENDDVVREAITTYTLFREKVRS